jgi:hypothetical protein
MSWKSLRQGVLACLLLGGGILTAQETAPAALEKVDGPLSTWTSKVHGSHVMAITRDQCGRLWFGTEGRGVWCCDPAQAGVPGLAAEDVLEWTQFNRVRTGGQPELQGSALTTGTADRNALGDDFVYALACDRKGRVWVGHLNHGVSVYDGRPLPAAMPAQGYAGWKNYDALSGPLGERVFDIAVSPVDGDVWIATSLGLSRYRDASDTWSHYRRLDGLPADQIQCLAFTAEGTLIAGTPCDGLAIAEAKRQGETVEYPAWRQVIRTDNAFNWLREPVGEGLPSPLINDILVTRAGIIHVATSQGLATSRDGGRSWSFFRGLDWEARCKGMEEPPTEQEMAAARQRIPAGLSLLNEDHCSGLAEAADGSIWIGHWRRDLEVRSPDLKQRLSAVPEAKLPNGGIYARTLLPDSRRGMLVGYYGEGIAHMALAGQPAGPAPAAVIPAAELPALPRADAGLSGKPLQEKLDRLLAFKLPQQPEFAGSFAGDDWTTGGDAYGRYGRSLSSYCATMGWGGDSFVKDAGFSVADALGSHPKNAPGPYRWTWEDNVKNRRVLYNPKIQKRRPGCWNDGGFAIPITTEGPELWIACQVPEGKYRISLYFQNFDGQVAQNRYRDFILSLHPDGPLVPPVAWARVSDWHWGVFKNCIVQGPGAYHLRLVRNGSFNTKLMGVMIDPIALVPAPIRQTPGQTLPAAVTPAALQEPDELATAEKFLGSKSPAWETGMAPLAARLLLRSVQNDAAATPEFRTLLRWHAGLWSQEDRQAFDRAMGR